MKANHTPSFFKLSALLFFLVISCSCKKQWTVDEYLDHLPQAKQISEQLEVDFTQPVDHNDPDGNKFTQRIILNHVGYDRPTVVQIAGYGIHSKKRGELAELLNANEIIIEHRYFKDSKPDSLNWKYLNIWQAATDHHKIIRAFKDLYHGKWISTGISKGGQATLFHRRFYPEDVDVSVPYVAPLNYSDEDRRIYEFLDNVGSKETRKAIYAFQKEVFERKKELLPMFEAYAKEAGYEFTMGIDRAYDLNVLEYPFAFWQWGYYEKDKIPAPDASDVDVFNHLIRVADGSFFEKGNISYNRPFFYQALTEIGMYGYEIEPFKAYLQDTNNITFEHTLPEGMTVEFDSTVMQDVSAWLKKEGNNMLYIYGEYDAWSATSFSPDESTNAVKMVNPRGSHRTRIQSFPEPMRDSIYNVLEKWLDVEIKTKNM